MGSGLGLGAAVLVGGAVGVGSGLGLAVGATMRGVIGIGVGEMAALTQAALENNIGIKASRNRHILHLQEGTSRNNLFVRSAYCDKHITPKTCELFDLLSLRFTQIIVPQ